MTWAIGTPKAALEALRVPVAFALNVTVVPSLILVMIEPEGTLLVTAVLIGIPTARPAVLAMVTTLLALADEDRLMIGERPSETLALPDLTKPVPPAPLSISCDWTVKAPLFA